MSGSYTPHFTCGATNNPNGDPIPFDYPDPTTNTSRSRVFSDWATVENGAATYTLQEVNTLRWLLRSINCRTTGIDWWDPSASWAPGFSGWEYPMEDFSLSTEFTFPWQPVPPGAGDAYLSDGASIELLPEYRLGLGDEFAPDLHKMEWRVMSPSDSGTLELANAFNQTLAIYKDIQTQRYSCPMSVYWVPAVNSEYDHDGDPATSPEIDKTHYLVEPVAPVMALTTLGAGSNNLTDYDPYGPVSGYTSSTDTYYETVDVAGVDVLFVVRCLAYRYVKQPLPPVSEIISGGALW